MDSNPTEPKVTPEEFEPQECNSDAGITVGIIDSIIVLCRLLDGREIESADGVSEALEDAAHTPAVRHFHSLLGNWDRRPPNEFELLLKDMKMNAPEIFDSMANGVTPEGIGSDMCECGHEREGHFHFGCACETERDVVCECLEFRLKATPEPLGKPAEGMGSFGDKGEWLNSPARKSEEAQLPPLESCPIELRHGYPECDCDLPGGDDSCKKTPTHAEVIAIYSPLAQRERQLLAALSVGKGQPVAEVMKDVISSLMTQVEAVEKEQGRWQDAIYKLLRKMVPDADIDGGGCDSGDALDFALEEIGQAIAALSAGKGQDEPVGDLMYERYKKYCESDLKPLMTYSGWIRKFLLNCDEAVGKERDEELICCVRNMREVLIHHETAGEERIQSEIRLASMALMAVGKAGGESAEDAWKRGVEFGVGAGVDGANLYDDAWVVPPYVTPKSNSKGDSQ